MEPSSRRSFHIGRYHCTETLLHGPLGETFRAKVYGVAGLEKQYALKQIYAMLRVDPEIRARLVEAARAYGTLEHDRIARLTEIVDDGDTLFFVTELSRGIDLPRLVAHLRGRDESLPVEQALLVAYDVAEALEIAHRPSEATPQGVLHLGLTPATVSVLGEGEVRVADFALSGALERPGWLEDDALVPLLTYTAPERLRGEPATAASDVWSVGAVLYELCAGVAPWSASTISALLAARAQPPSWDKLASRPGLRELLERIMADDPAARPQTAAALREDLAAVLGLELTRARVGLQGLVKRALGRTTTRTGSFAAVAIPSGSMPSLAPEPAPTPFPSSNTGRVTLGGLALKKAPSAPEPVVEAPARAWAPPRATGVMTVVRPPEEAPAPEPAQMELAELPPAVMNEATVTERNMDVVAFDDVMTAPESRPVAEPGEVLEADALELEEVHDAPTRPGALPPPPEAFPSGRFSTLQGTGPQLAPMVDGSPPVAVVTAAPEPVPTAPPSLAPPPAVPAPTPPPQPVASAPPAPAPKPRSNAVAWIVGALVGVGVASAVMLLVEHNGTTMAPVAEAPKPAPTVETPKPEAPKPEAPKPEAPKPEAPKPVAPVAPVAPTPPPASAGQLAISTEPAGASVWIDGELRGTTPLSTTATPGKHRVILALNGYKLAQKNLEVDAQGASLALPLETAKLPAELRGEGGLKVRCRTQNELRILVDGNDTGLTCPNAERISVAPGAHTIGLQSPRTGEVKEVAGEVGDDPDHSTRIYVTY